MTSSNDPWVRLRLLALTAATVVGIGVAGYMTIEQWSFIDALYMTLTTLTTVGFGEVHPLTQPGRVFTIALLSMGVALITILLALLAQLVQEGALGERGRRRRMQKRIETLKDHYIVCGYGRVGRRVVEEMELERAAFVVIDRNPEVEDELIEAGFAYLIANPANDDVLGDAGIERARCLVSAVDDDTDNAYITLTARALNQDVYIVARAAEERTAQHLERAGADRVILPAVTGGRDMAHQALHRRVVDTLDFARDSLPPLLVEEVLIEDGSELSDRPVHEAVGKAKALALARGRQVMTPPDDGTRLQPGDRLLLLGDREQLRPLEGN
jgi:voltage-gated potassium channel